MKRLLILAAVGFSLLIPVSAEAACGAGGCGIVRKAGAGLRRVGGVVRKVAGRLVHPFRRG